MITLLKQIAIREHVDTDLTNPDPDPYTNVVILTNIMEGVDGAATFGYSLETVAVQVEDNQTQQYKHIHTLDVRVLDAGSDNATIDAWILEQKSVDIVGYGVDGYFQFDNVKLTRNKQYDEVFASAFLATAETVTSYSSPYQKAEWKTFGGNPIYRQTQLKNANKLRAFAGVNLYDIYQLDVTKSNVQGASGSVWQNGIANNYALDSTFVADKLTSNVDGKNITLTRPKTSYSYLNYEYIFTPFQDLKLTASVNVVDVNTGAGGANPTFRVFARGDYGERNVAWEQPITTEGRKSFDITINPSSDSSNALTVLFMGIRPSNVAASNITYDDIGVYIQGYAPFDPNKTIVTPNTNASNVVPIDP